MAIIWSCGLPGSTPHFHAELLSNGCGQRRPSTESFREHEEIRFLPISCVVRPFSSSTSTLHVHAKRKMVQVRRVRRGPASDPRSLPLAQVGLRFDVSFAGQGLLVDSGRR